MSCTSSDITGRYVTLSARVNRTLAARALLNNSERETEMNNVNKGEKTLNKGEKTLYRG